ncbi:hypothetical protein ACQ4M3_05275 [Leptolyngbya sp. AN03gr2]|uniref:hypothetical protein n=1 Tax=unclassified Leptolyngbya TaxID=2650499 RepID=UPI003D3189A3
MALRAQDKSTGKTDPVRTGNRDFDGNRFKPKSVNDKAEKSVGVDTGAQLGDFIEGLVTRLLSPSVMMVAGYVGAGVCLAIGIHAYGRLLIPALAGSLPIPLDYAAGVALSVVLGAGLQLLEIFPRLDTYFPGTAEQLAVKLKLSPVAQPKADRHSPSLLPQATDMAKTSSERLFKDMQGASAIAYGIETLGALWAFQLITAGTLNVPGIIGAIIAVVGFEICLKFSSWMKQIRLTARQSRHYREHQRRLRSEAAQDFNPQQPK